MPKVEIQHTHTHTHNLENLDIDKLVKALTKGAIGVTLVYLGGNTISQVLIYAARRG